jgi:hypothetical protein
VPVVTEPDDVNAPLVRVMVAALDSVTALDTVGPLMFSDPLDAMVIGPENDELPVNVTGVP